MGQISEDILDGLMCSDCGVCFVEEHGCPVICKECAKEYSKAELREDGLKVAWHKEVGE